MERNDLVAFGIRPGMVQIGRWKNDFPAIVQQCAKFCSLSSSPSNGWSGNMQWSVFKSSTSFRVYSETKRFVYYEAPEDGNTVSVIFADKDFYPMVLAAMGDISQSVFDQAHRLSSARHNAKTFLHAWQELCSQSYPQWARDRSREVAEDPLVMALDQQYRPEYEEVRDRTQMTMRDCLFKQARMRGARYISINPTFFSVLDGVRTDGLRSSPVAHQIGSDLNIVASTCGPYSFRAMNLASLFGDDIEGIWHVDTDSPVKIGDRSLNERRATSGIGSWGKRMLDELLTSQW